MDTEFFRVLEHPRRTNGFTVYHLEHELDLLSDLHRGGRGLSTRAHGHARAAPRPTHLPLATPRTPWLARAHRALTRSPRPLRAPYAAHALVLR